MLDTYHPTGVSFLTRSLRPCNVRSHPRRGDAVTEKVRLEVLTTASQRDGVRLQIERCIEQNRNQFDFKLSQIPHIEAAIDALKQGTGDLVAMSALNWREFNVEGLSIVGILPRREPTWVLVSNDKPEYLVSQAIVICDHELLRRQMRRLRSDLKLVTSEEFATMIGKSDVYANLDEEDKIHWIEECRQDELLEGYIVARGEHAALKFKARRHTLGLQRENPERTHFLQLLLLQWSILVQFYRIELKRVCSTLYQNIFTASSEFLSSNVSSRRYSKKHSDAETTSRTRYFSILKEQKRSLAHRNGNSPCLVRKYPQPHVSK
jgi:hypothetical protein